MELTVLSYNLWFKPQALAERTEALIATLLTYQPDLICFQEVLPEVWDQLRTSLSDQYPYYTPHQIYGYGVATLSRYPITEHLSYPFPHSRMGRELQLVKIQLPLMEISNPPSSSHPSSAHPASSYSSHEYTEFVEYTEATHPEVPPDPQRYLLLGNAHFESEFHPWKENREKLSQYRSSQQFLQLMAEGTPEVILACDSNLLAQEEKHFFPEGWQDSWRLAGNQEEEYTYDTTSNPHLRSLSKTYRSRLDRILFRGSRLTIRAYQRIVGIEGLIQPSDHYGVLTRFQLD